MTHKEYIVNVKNLNCWSYAYYTGEEVLATDEEYDTLYKEVQAYEEANPFKINALSPTQNLEEPILDFQQKKQQPYSID